MSKTKTELPFVPNGNIGMQQQISEIEFLVRKALAESDSNQFIHESFMLEGAISDIKIDLWHDGSFILKVLMTTNQISFPSYQSYEFTAEIPSGAKLLGKGICAIGERSDVLGNTFTGISTICGNYTTSPSSYFRMGIKNQSTSANIVKAGVYNIY